MHINFLLAYRGLRLPICRFDSGAQVAPLASIQAKMFKQPSTIPQDLLLISDIVSTSNTSGLISETRKRASSTGSRHASSECTTDSEEEEVVENLLAKPERSHENLAR